MKLRKHLRDAIEEYVEHMEGWSTPERCCDMAQAIIETDAQICVDIGVYAARSTISMGFAAREMGTSRVYGIDSWRVDDCAEGGMDPLNEEWWKTKSRLEDMHQATMKSIWDHRLEQWVTIIRNASQNVVQLFDRIDFLNIDGSHNEVASCRDVELYVPRVRSGGIVFMDDIRWFQTQKALTLLDSFCDKLSEKDTEKGSWAVYKKR